jgi:hypothetical protein
MESFLIDFLLMRVFWLAVCSCILTLPDLRNLSYFVSNGWCGLSFGDNSFCELKI